MAVHIDGMDKPTSCTRCPFYITLAGFDEHKVCCITGHDVTDMYYGVDDNCPITQIEE